MSKMPICYCGSPTHLDTNAKIYNGREYGNGKIWLCDRYPDCRGSVGVHPDNRPLGTIADPETKKWRIAVHDRIDKLWKNNPKSKGRHGGRLRGSVYKWLRGLMKMSAKECHIGNFTTEQCIEALEQIALHPYSERNK
jgi:ssDNA-binding Zn-finger/Zn-ribbon topoisomerase 1